jgi:hypothetical protein
MLAPDLPELIAGACDIASYRVERDGSTCTIIVGFEGSSGIQTVEYSGIPVPDERGVFEFREQPVVIVPLAWDETLSEVRCVGEQFRDYLSERMTSAPDGMLNDPNSIRAWFPLEEWTEQFFDKNQQHIDSTNAISISTHLHRIRLRPVGDFTPPADIAPKCQIGLACPIEFPQGPNAGLVLTVALGAEIRDGAVVRKQEGSDTPTGPVSNLGASASYIPFIERSDPARLMMGANMMRQWLVPLDHERPIVRTGNEPDDEEYWCGFNLLTAYASFGRLTYEDAIVLSESAVARMRYSDPVSVGDKFSSRHGQKGLVSRIAPDDEMPKLPDGRSVELVFSFTGLHTRMHSGELCEAVYSNLIRAGKMDPVVPQFASPDREELRKALKEASLPDDGMVRLTFLDGTTTERPVVAGEVYWGRLYHTAINKIKANGADSARQLQGEMEYWALRDSGAFVTIHESNSMTAEGSPDIGKAVETIEKNSEPMMPGGSGKLLELQRKLKLAGIEAVLGTEGLSFAFADLAKHESVFTFPEPSVHPWRSTRSFSAIPENPDSPLWPDIVRAAQRLRERVNHYFDTLIEHADLICRGRIFFSGRSVIVPGAELKPHQIGIPEEIAWVLFEPHVIASVGAEAARERGEVAADALRSIVSSRWVRINRAPTLTETAMLAFQGVVVPHRAIELHPMLCRWLNADFDGDQIAIMLPLTKAGQREAKEKLSVVGHLTRNPELVRTLVPSQESLWGLSRLSLTKTGRKHLEEILGILKDIPKGYLTSSVLADAAAEILERVGPEKTVEALESLFDLGLEEARRTGGSLNPFMRPPIQADRIADLSHDEVVEAFAASTDFENPEFGTQLLLAKSGARGGIENLVMLCHSRSYFTGMTSLPHSLEPTSERGQTYTNSGHLDGLAPDELFDAALNTRKHIARLVSDLQNTGSSMRSEKQPKGYGILARAVRADRPGVVFASAAAAGEVDPLTDIDARLFAGLQPEE